jgi:XRE family transcriptional regulator, regulator of sulfur utilization
MDEVTRQTAANLAAIRKERSLSLDEVARLSGVSKSMLRQIERGASSPTISTLWKIANGLKVSFSSLVKENGPVVSVVDNRAGPPLLEEKGGYRLYPLFPFEAERKFEVYHVEIARGVRLASEGHRGGVEEYLFVMAGTLRLGVQEKSWRVGRDHSIRFDAAGSHSYENRDAATVKMIMLICYPRG